MKRFRWKLISSLTLAFMAIISFLPNARSAWTSGSWNSVSSSTTASATTTSVTPVARIGSRYYLNLGSALEDAYGNGSNDTIYVIPGLGLHDEDSGIWAKTQTTLTQGHQVRTDSEGYAEYIVESGDSLILPYALSGDSASIESSGSGDAFSDNTLSSMQSYCQTELIIDSGVKLSVTGTLSVGGIWGHANSGICANTSGNYAQISMKSGSKIDVTGTANVYGFIKEYDEDDPSDGIEVDGTLNAPVVFYDFHGGQWSTSVYGSFFPMDIFDFPNVQVAGKVSSSGVFCLQSDIYAASTHNKSSFNLTSNNNSSLFQFSTGGYFGFDYTPAAYETISTNGVSRKIGLTKNDKSLSTKAVTHMTFSGDVSVNNISVSVTYIFTVTMTSADKFIPMSYKFSMNQASGTMTVPSSIKIKFMPGSVYTVDEGAAVNILGEAIAYTEFNEVSVDGQKYPTGLDAAKVICNGTATISGGFGGLILTENTSGTASVNFRAGSSYSVSSPEVSDTGTDIEVSYYGVEYSNVTKSAIGYIESATVTSEFSSYSDTARLFISSESGAYWEIPPAISIGYSFDTSASNSGQVSSASFYVNGEIYTKSGSSFDIVEGNSFTLSNYFGIEKFEVIYNGSVVASGSEVTVESAVEGMSVKAYVAEAYLLTLEATGTGGRDYSDTDVSVIAYTYDCSTMIETVCSIEVYNWFGHTDPSSSGYISSLATFKINATSGLYSSVTVTGANQISGTSFYRPTGTVTVSGTGTYYESCLGEGTLITLADGTQKTIEDLTSSDLLISLNHETGNYEETAILAVEKMESSSHNVIDLGFAAGKELTIIDYHGLFDLTLMKYVFIDSQNCQEYVGHRFAVYSNGRKSETTLISCSTSVQEIATYSVATYKNINAIANGLLTITPFPGIEEAVNAFEFAEDLSWDAAAMQRDIATYGLYSYEEWSWLIEESYFDGFNVKYFKVAVGKGLITEENITSFFGLVKNKVDDGDVSDI